MLWAGIACLVVIAGFFAWWLFQPGQGDARAVFAIACAFVFVCLVAWSARWQPPKGR
jgi:hypothetical protein